MTTCDQHHRRIFLTARSCVGSPFRHQGRSLEHGLDCVGLIVYVTKTLGLSYFDLADYKKIPEKKAISRIAQTAGFTERPICEMMPGNVIILRVGKYLEHSAIVSDSGIIHACEKYGKVVEHGMNSEWQSRIISVQSFPGFSNNNQGTV